VLQRSTTNFRPDASAVSLRHQACQLVHKSFEVVRVYRRQCEERKPFAHGCRKTAAAAYADIQQPPSEHNIWSGHTPSAYIQQPSRNGMSPPVSSHNTYSGQQQRLGTAIRPGTMISAVVTGAQDQKKEISRDAGWADRGSDYRLRRSPEHERDVLFAATGVTPVWIRRFRRR
jgi:hypothetical protein